MKCASLPLGALYLIYDSWDLCAGRERERYISSPTRLVAHQVLDAQLVGESHYILYVVLIGSVGGGGEQSDNDYSGHKSGLVAAG